MPTLLGPTGQPLRTAPRRASIRARYDAARTTPENARHWSAADGLSARGALTPDVRDRLRRRARYENQNNSYCRGIVLTVANDLIGTGPRLQLLTEDDEVNRRVERAFAEWADETRFAAKLRTLCQAKIVDGEGVALMANNPAVTGPVQLDLKLVEADQLSTPWSNPADPLAVDGIYLDDWGNPVEYHFLRYHPGDPWNLGTLVDRYPARVVLHWFRADRPGQYRGVPEITPALELFAQLRRYTLAVLAAAETAADFSAVLYSELAPETGVSDGDPFESLDIERRMMTTLPAGWKMGQFKAEQPAQSYDMFKKEILNEIARCLNVPFNVAAGNSSSYNYSSGRLDHQTYYKSMRVERSEAELVLLDRIFAAWLDEASLTTDLIPDGPGRLEGWPHQWFWDGQEHVDPQKEALAQETRLRNRTTTYAGEFARQGKDWEAEFRQIAKEQALLDELGLTVAAPGQAQPQAQQQPQPAGEDNVPED